MAEALYRKYRPQSFKEVLGQEAVISVLTAAVKSGKTAHAYLFTGSRGTGKTSVARILAAALGCQPADLVEIDAASNRGIGEIRELQEGVRTLPFMSPVKVYVIDEVHMLTKEAFNALLKTLEEPPAHAVFILATTELNKVPETILSRCEVHHFKAPSVEILDKALTQIAKSENLKLGKGVAAAKESGLPVSVKTRLGYNQIDLNWIKQILETKPVALTVHLRTRKEMSKVAAHWEIMPEIMKLAQGSGVIILGNGDVKTPAEAREKCKQYGCDGVMIGRGIFGNPWLYAEHVPTKEEKLKVLLEHTKLFADLYLPGETNTKLFNGHTKSFAVMKKHFKAYVDGFPASPAGGDGAADLRAKLMECNSVEEVEKIIQPLL